MADFISPVASESGAGTSSLIVGIDEAGRGCWAGPVVAAAFRARGPLPSGVRDSKRLTAKARERLYAELTSEHGWAVGVASAAEIDAHNILQATLLAMRRAYAVLGTEVAHEVIVDGNQDPRLDTDHPVRTLVKADDLIPEVAAASIIAKHWRDMLLKSLDLRFPGYGFAKHSGYGVPAHAKALGELGPCAEHRHSFAPIKAMLRAFQPTPGG